MTIAWRPVTKNSPAKDRAIVDRFDSDPIHMFMEKYPWILGDGEGVAIVAPLTPRWLDPSSRAATWPYTSSPHVPPGYVVCLTACAIKSEHRRQGHCRDLIRILRNKYGGKLLISAAVLGGMGWLDGQARG